MTRARSDLHGRHPAVLRTAVLRTAAALATAVLIVPIAACSQPPPDVADLDRDSTEVTYTFVGASTPPQYHKEYRIDVVHGRATIRVGGYGTVDGTAAPKHTVTATVGAAAWNDMTDRLNELPTRDHTADGCTGGSTFEVTVTTDGRRLAHSQAYACGSEFDAVAAPFTQFIAPIEGLFDMSRLLSD